MSKFNTTSARPAVTSPITSEHTPSAVTHQGGTGYARDTRSELFLLAVTNMVSENTFYEPGGTRDERYTNLVAQAALTDPDWTARFLRWLRTEANMRTASLVGAAEYVHARLTAAGTRPAAQHETTAPDGTFEGDQLSYQTFTNRAVIDSVLLRADEPGELLAYWTAVHGRNIPKPVKRGIADAVQRLYTERALLKWDSEARGYRMGDVLELVHASPNSPWQGDLFAHAIDRRHNRDNPIPDSLRMIRTRDELMNVPVEKRRSFLRLPGLDKPYNFGAAGMTWESLAGWLQGPMDAAAWEAMIPTMGYMALLRNLRNFDEAGVTDTVAEQVAAQLADPEQVARSRQLPMRFLSAYRAAPSLRWGHALEQALAACLANVPALPGRTLVLVDRSGSMFWDKLSERSDLTRADGAALFGTALSLRAEHADLVQYGSTSSKVQLSRGDSILRVVAERFADLGGTDTAGAIRTHYAGHDRVVIVTDEQHNGSDGGALDNVPANVPTYTWNLAGYKHGHAPSGAGNRHAFGGLTDAGFRMIPLLEAGRNADWPF